MRDALKKLLSDGVLQDLNFNESTKQYELHVKEPDNCKPNELSEFKIIDIPENTAAFSLDYRNSKDPNKNRVKNSRVKNLSWLINTKLKKANMNCDIIVIAPNSDNENHIVIIGELKSGLSNYVKSKAKKQLFNSRIVINFIFELIQEHKLGEIGSPDFKKIIFSNDEKAETLNPRPHTRVRNEDVIYYVSVKDGDRKHWNKIKEIIGV